MVAINSHRGVRYGVAVMICLVLVSAVGGPIITAMAATQGHQQSHGQNQTHGPNRGQRHTLVIIHVAGSPSWSIRASGSIQLDKQTTEQTDSIARTAASGSVGGLPWEENASDPKDVIYYTGTLLEFDLGGTGNARVTLDGKRVNPQSLKNTPTPTRTGSSPTTTPTTMPPTTTHSPTTPTPAPTTNESTPSNSPGTSVLDQLISEHGGVFILIALGLVTVLYLRIQ
jgi:hypothetical protein